MQRGVLKAALRSKGSTNDALALIETRFAADPSCGHCGSKHFGTWGRANGLRRYKCKDCGRTFNALTSTPMAQLHKRDAWLAYARARRSRQPEEGGHAVRLIPPAYVKPFVKRQKKDTAEEETICEPAGAACSPRQRF